LCRVDLDKELLDIKKRDGEKKQIMPTTRKKGLQHKDLFQHIHFTNKGMGAQS
jgi:hypothetical protein